MPSSSVNMRGSTTSLGFGVRKNSNEIDKAEYLAVNAARRGASPAAARRRGWKCGITAVAKFRERRIKLESNNSFWRTNFSRNPIVKRRNGELVRLQETLLRRGWKKMNDFAQKKTVKEARLRLEKEMEMVLVVEKLQELRSLRVQKLKKQGHLFPEDDDAFTESVLPANAEEQTTRNPSTDDENTIKEAPP
ncbi:U11/U12 small nuclear ribonucleoprotein 59 kDa protein [Selaginella moellendorffii]|uniref:U11/U12 small nuclear ribonucleoprotein 59 kDa protein n=1 Tax=Selaginella moellendorffii TaxID=88036 RepID=UPI000D1CCDD8|nr:U11/U12 small nuclear ribonucleoprotein 59 kDa protein [Selaginella moellendorffii]|eukprot:XP_024531341.1 U11/U12 small nuclear ribonucleoprotein 59 kDa protein [Selaginella moellendorffii]